MTAQTPLTLDMLRRGDPETIRRFSLLLVRMARRYIPSKQEAESVAREAMADMLAQLANGEEPTNLKTWVRTAVSRAARRAIRRYKRYPVEFMSRIHTGDEQRTFSAVQNDRDQLDRIHGTMQTMPETTREAIVATAVEGRTIESVAAQLDQPAPTIRNKLLRARRKFKRVLSH